MEQDLRTLTRENAWDGDLSMHDDNGEREADVDCSAYFGHAPGARIANYLCCGIGAVSKSLLEMSLRPKAPPETGWTPTGGPIS